MAAFAAGPAPALSVAGAPALRVGCPAKTFFVTFSPSGVAADREPHVRVYTRSEALAVVYPARASFGRSCKSVKDAVPSWGGGSSKTTGRKLSLRCSVPSAPALRSAPLTGPAGTYVGTRLVATTGKAKAFLAATMRKPGSSLRYSTRYCAVRP